MVQICPIFVNVYTIEIANAGGVKKSQNLVNVVCERPLGMPRETRSLRSPAVIQLPVPATIPQGPRKATFLTFFFFLLKDSTIVS